MEKRIMEIEIFFCNNIDHAKISIDEKKLNILFAPNGTGKSTIANAIELGTEKNEGDMNKLLPFKYRASNPNNCKPKLSGIDEIKFPLCFNEKYVKEVVFQKDELLKNSFDILIRNDEYIKLEQEINELTKEIRELFVNNKDLDTLLLDLNALSHAFKFNSNGGLAKTSTGSKGLQGNKVQHVPAELEKYKAFIQSQNNITWIDWHLTGLSFIELDENCPFCTAQTTNTKETIKKVSTEYDKNIIKNLTVIIDILSKLGDYFFLETFTKLDEITKLPSGIDSQHESYISTVIVQINGLISCLEDLKHLSAFTFSKDEKVNEKLSKYILDISNFPSLKSDKTSAIITTLNSSIQKLLDKAGLLQGKVSIQRQKTQELIEKNKVGINNFLQKAGYKYEVDIVGEIGKSQLKLRHRDHTDFITGGDQHLSFGEKNAFAIILFMYECLSKKPGMIILDDPISSFDKNKKYAILQMLFDEGSSASLRNETVIMLTHDIEPIIDTIKSLHKRYNNRVSASFLHLSKGKIAQYKITKDDLLTFTQICTDIITSQKDIVIKLIYLRRYYEVVDKQHAAYQVLSNLFHKRDTCFDQRLDRIDGNFPRLTDEEFANGCEAIRKDISDFVYEEALAKFKNNEELSILFNNCTNGYEKLQLFRIICGESIDENDKEKSVLRKFFNETYHIENEFIYQLNPAKFDTIPEYIVDMCTNILANQ